MDRETLESRFQDAARAACEIARHYVVEELPTEILFRVRIQGFAQTVGLQACGEARALRQLWRSGSIPCWVNLTVVGEIGRATIVEVLASDHFTTDDAVLYHKREGRAPFHILSPGLAPGFKEGVKVSIYQKTTCWLLADLKRATQQSSRVLSLELNGAEFDDSTLDEVRAFQNLEVLELRGTAITDEGVRTLADLTHLRVLRSG